MTPPRKKAAVKAPPPDPDPDPFFDAAEEPDASSIATEPPAEDVPEWVTWWDPTLTRYVGGRHAADTEPPEGVEVHPYVNTRDLQDWSG